MLALSNYKQSWCGSGVMMDEVKLAELINTINIYRKNRLEFERDIRNSFNKSFSKTNVKITDIDVRIGKHSYAVITLSSNMVRYEYLNDFISNLKFLSKNAFISMNEDSLIIKFYFK